VQLLINHAIQTYVRRRPLDTPVQKRILQALAGLADENGEINRSLPEIAARAQACRKTVIRVLHELADLEEILILNTQRVRGHYRINHLPGDEKPRIDSLRMPIVEAIRLLPLPVRVSVIFQAMAKYASRQGNNIFPSLKTLMRDTGYCKPIIQETVRWLLRTGFIQLDKDCINPNYQARAGYLIPGWNANAQLLLISEEQIDQIKVLYRHHNQHYWARQGGEEAGQDQKQEDLTWLEDHSFDFDEYESGNSAALGEETEDQELVEDEPVPDAEEQVSAPQNPQEEKESAAALPSIKPQVPPSEMIRAVLSPQHRRNIAVSLTSYHTARKAMQQHLDIIADHESGQVPIDEATLQKSLTIVGFYQRTIDAYELQCEQRE